MLNPHTCPELKWAFLPILKMTIRLPCVASYKKLPIISNSWLVRNKVQHKCFGWQTTQLVRQMKLSSWSIASGQTSATCRYHFVTSNNSSQKQVNFSVHFDSTLQLLYLLFVKGLIWEIKQVRGPTFWVGKTIASCMLFNLLPAFAKFIFNSKQIADHIYSNRCQSITYMRHQAHELTYCHFVWVTCYLPCYSQFA